MIHCMCIWIYTYHSPLFFLPELFRPSLNTRHRFICSAFFQSTKVCRQMNFNEIHQKGPFQEKFPGSPAPNKFSKNPAEVQNAVEPHRSHRPLCTWLSQSAADGRWLSGRQRLLQPVSCSLGSNRKIWKQHILPDSQNCHTLPDSTAAIDMGTAIGLLVLHIKLIRHFMSCLPQGFDVTPVGQSFPAQRRKKQLPTDLSHCRSRQFWATCLEGNCMIWGFRRSYHWQVWKYHHLKMSRIPEVKLHGVSRNFILAVEYRSSFRLDRSGVNKKLGLRHTSFNCTNLGWLANPAFE